MSALFQLGYVSRAHGTRGEIVVRTFDPASSALYDVDRAVLRLRDGTEKAVVIAECAQQGKDLRVSLEGVSSRPQSEALVGSTVLVYREDLEAPSAGEYFQGDLIGLEVFDVAGARVGRLEEILDAGPVPNLVIRDGDREELVPFADDFVQSVDLDARRIVVRLLEFAE